MATYYWVGGTGTWNNTSTLNWSNTSGGADGFGPPTSSDTVIFDGGSSPGSTSWIVTVASTATSASTTIQESPRTGRFYFTLSLSGSPTLTTTGPLTFNYGIINLNNNTLTVHSFVSTHIPSSIEQRDLDFGSSGKIVCTAYSGTVFNNTTSYLSVLPLSGGERRVEVYVPSTSQITTFTSTGRHFSLYLVNGGSSGSGTLQATSPAQLRNLSIPNNSFTFSYSIIDLCGSLTIGGSNPTLSSSGGSFYFNFTDDLPSSNGDIFDINTNGKTIPSTFNFNHLDRTCRLLNNLVTTVSNNLSSGGLNLNGYTFQSKDFSSSGSGVRSLQFGSGGKLTLIGDPTVDFTIFDARTTTNFTVVDPSNSLVELSVPSNPRTSSVYPSTTDNALLNFSTIASSGGLNNGYVYLRSSTAGANVYIRDLVLYNAAYVLQTNNNLNIKGSLNVIGNSVNLSNVSTSYTVTIGTTDPSAANNTISIGTQVLNFNIKTIGNNSLSRGVVLNSNVTQSANRTFTLESGRLDLNNYTLTTNTFSSSNSNNRNVDFKTSGSIVLQDNAFVSTPISINDSTNLSVYGSGGFKLQVGNPPSAGKTITGGTSGVTSYLNTFNLELIAAVGTNNGSMNIAGNFRSLVLYDGPYTFTMTSSKTLWGSFTLPNTNANLILSSSSSNNITFKNSIGSGADNTITTNSFTIPFPIVIDNFESSGLSSFKLASNFVSTSSVTLTSGVFDGNGYNLTTTSFASNNSNTRTLKLGNGTWTLNGNGTVWNLANGTNLTLNVGTSNIVLNNSFNSSFYGGGKTYGSVILDGAATLTNIFGSNTFSSLSSFRLVSNSLKFEAGTTNYFNNFSVSGTGPSSIVTLTGVTNAIFYMIKTGGGTINLDYMNISYSHVAPSATWNVGPNSVDSGNNSGWVGFPPPSPPSNGFMVFF